MVDKSTLSFCFGAAKRTRYYLYKSTRYMRKFRQNGLLKRKGFLTRGLNLGDPMKYALAMILVMGGIDRFGRQRMGCRGKNKHMRIALAGRHQEHRVDWQ